MIYTYNNIEFSLMKALSKYTGVGEKTIAARLRRGMSVEEACQKKDLRCSQRYIENEGKSITQICKEQNKDIDLVLNRLKYGYTLNEALNKPKKISRQGREVVVNGILYNSVSEALRKLGLQEKESTVRVRLMRGVKPDEAFKF